MIQLDGSHGEGGGAIVRVALAMSTLTQQPFEVKNIRHGRPKPGLKAQHLHCIKALQRLCNAEVEGAELGSEYLKYCPGKADGKIIDIDIGTAGSITLLLQSLLIPCFFAENKTTLNLAGGTSGKWQMPIDYFRNVFVPHLKKYADIDVKLIKRGYYPKGGGKVTIVIESKPGIRDSDPLKITEQGKLVEINGLSHASSNLKEVKVAERQADSAKDALSSAGCPVKIGIEYNETLSVGTGITLWARFSEDGAIIGSDAIGEKGKKAEAVGKEAAENLLREIKTKAPVDTYLADNLIPLLGLFGGSIKVAKISNHTRTNIYVVEKFLDRKFSVDEENRIISTN